MRCRRRSSAFGSGKIDLASRIFAVNGVPSGCPANGTHTGALDMENPSAKGAEPTPEPAVPAILAAFDKYEVVGMQAAHGLKDLDDFILSLIRAPAFADKVNDIAVECGNSLYQPELDRYIAGQDVPFTSARKAWRK
jgi:hypothetical protein